MDLILRVVCLVEMKYLQMVEWHIEKCYMNSILIVKVISFFDIAFQSNFDLGTILSHELTHIKDIITKNHSRCV